MPPVSMAFRFTRLADAVTASTAKKNVFHPNFRNNVNFMEGELGKTTYFAGQKFSAADCQMSFVVELLEMGGFIGDSQPKLAGWLSTIRARPAYQKALHRGGEGNYSLSVFKDWLV